MMSKVGVLFVVCYGFVSIYVMIKVENICLFILDVDGVLFDGLIYMGNNGEELKVFNVCDGYGICCVLIFNIEVVIIIG